MKGREGRGESEKEGRGERGECASVVGGIDGLHCPSISQVLKALTMTETPDSLEFLQDVALQCRAHQDVKTNNVKLITYHCSILCYYCLLYTSPSPRD